MTDAGTTVFAPGSTLAVSNDVVLRGGHILRLQGAGTWSAGRIFSGEGALLEVASALGALRASRGGIEADLARLTGRARNLVAELITRQNDDGGWPWVGASGQAASVELPAPSVSELTFRLAAKPLFAPMVATVGSEEFQVTALVRS